MWRLSWLPGLTPWLRLGLNLEGRLKPMALASLVCSLLVNPSAVTVKNLPLSKVPNEAGFTVYRPSSIPVGYKLVKASLYQWESKSVLKLSYVNRTSFTQMDLIQSPASGSSHSSHLKGLLNSGKVEMDLSPETTFVTGRKAGTDIGLAGTLISVGSAKKVIDTMAVWKRQG